MKNTQYTILIAFVLILACMPTAWSQTSCLPDGITFTTQEEIDNFPMNYPGCQVIDGPLVIRGFDIVNLNGLASLVKVANLQIDSTSLINLEGLNNLDSIVTILTPPISLIVSNNPLLANIESINNLKEVNAGISIINNVILESIQPLSDVRMSYAFQVRDNSSITEITGFNKLTGISAANLFQIRNNNNLQIINGFNGMEISYSYIQITGNNKLEQIIGFDALTETSFNIWIEGQVLELIDGFSNLKKSTGFSINSEVNININAFFNLEDVNTISIIGDTVDFIQQLIRVDSLDYLTMQASYLRNGINFFPKLHTAGNIIIKINHLIDMTGLDSLKIVKDKFHLGEIAYHIDSNIIRIDSLKGLENLEYVNSLRLFNILGLSDFEGLNFLKKVETRFDFHNLIDLVSLQGLSSLDSVGLFAISDCSKLFSLEGLESLSYVGYMTVSDNINLSVCSTPNICHLLETTINDLHFWFNGTNCQTTSEVRLLCGTQIEIALKSTDDCAIDKNLDFDSRLYVEISIPKYGAKIIREFTDNKLKFHATADQLVIVKPLGNFPYWEFCIDSLVIQPDIQDDSLMFNYMIMPLDDDCPHLDVKLSLPPDFRGCLVPTDMKVRTQNTGTIPAENVQLSVIIPFDLMVVESVSPPPISQNGDTLFFALGDLDIFEVAEVNLTVRTRCDTFLLDHTICIEAFAEMDNPCPPILPVGSLIQTTATCLGNDIVRFTLTNIGDEPTTAPHHYFIIEDMVVLMTQEFDLDVMESIQVDVDATGSTFRMEATKLPDGTLTAAALEGCGGFTPGMMNAFWMDEGFSHYDIGCRQVTLAYDPNDKLAIPTGVGPDNLLVANRPIEYTIRFQNTGTDTAYRVLLTDILPPELDVTTFRPGFASHDYTWEIRGLDTLEVLFFPIALPDSAASQEGSQGFFTFSLDQQPDLPIGSLIQNTASIVFDFNPPIVTNTVFHTIGKLTVSIDHPQPQAGLWQLLGNPMGDQAIFRSTVAIPGVKRFELFDLMGHEVRQEEFYGDEYLFQRGMLRGGMYVFRLIDEQSRQFTGKIVLAE